MRYGLSHWSCSRRPNQSTRAHIPPDPSCASHPFAFRSSKREPESPPALGPSIFLVPSVHRSIFLLTADLNFRACYLGNIVLRSMYSGIIRLQKSSLLKTKTSISSCTSPVLIEKAAAVNRPLPAHDLRRFGFRGRSRDIVAASGSLADDRSDMKKTVALKSFLYSTVVMALLLTGCANAVPFPDPATDAPKAEGAAQTAVLAGGCFWGVEAVFDALAGVQDAVSGYAGGSADQAHYEIVSTGRTGHAEAVQITYDPSRITYGQILKVYFSIAHDPTQLNRQGPDRGTQYRSAVFYANDEQKRIAEAYIQQLNQAKIYPRAIVTKLESL